MTRRFDSEDYLTEWRDGRTFPPIHDGIYALAEKHLPLGETVVDLGACTGLLSRRLSDVLGLDVIAVEPHHASRLRGARYGTWGDRIHVHTLPISSKAGIGHFRTLLTVTKPTAIVARRVFPEIYESTELVEPGSWDDFVAALNASTVTMIIVEGRKFSTRTTHPLGNLDLEIAALGPRWAVTERDGDLAVLEKIDAPR